MVTLLGSRKASIASLLLIVASHSISSGNAAVIDRTPSAHIQGRGCINTVPTWTIGSFNHEVNNGVSTVKFILNSNTAQGQLTCSGQAPSGHSVQISGNCNSEQVAAQFAFDTASESLRINQVSACDGGATSIPVEFVGTTIIVECKNPLECSSKGSFQIPARLKNSS